MKIARIRRYTVGMRTTIFLMLIFSFFVHVFVLVVPAFADVEAGNFELDPVVTYTVTYDGNGGTDGVVPTDSNVYTPGSSVIVLDNTDELVNTGYKFNGWNTSADGDSSGYVAGDTFFINADTTLYAQWVDAVAPVITLNGDLSMAIAFGQTFIDPEAVTDDGSPVIVTGSVKTSVAGIYYLYYNATDKAGNVAEQKERTVSVLPPYETTAGQVLGVNTTFTGSNSGSSSTGGGTEQSDSSNTPEVLGAATTVTGTSDDDSTAGKTDEKSTGGTNKDTVWSWLGLAWYWWLAILVIFMGVVWWIIAARKRNRDDSQNIYRL